VVAIHDFDHSCTQWIATGQVLYDFSPRPALSPDEINSLVGSHLCTRTEDDFESGEFHVCPDESQFSVSMLL